MRKFLYALVLAPSLLFGQRDSLDIKIGQMIIMGLDNFNELDESEPMFLDIRDGILGNVILYSKHINQENPKSALQEITEHIQSIAPIPVFIGIDEEGGRVNRLKPKYGFPKTRSAQKLGEINQKDSTTAYASSSAKAMTAMGINMNFAPTLDVNVNPQNPVIGRVGRSYSEDETEVARHGLWMIQAQQRQGIVNVVKHFPGHGSSSTDSHLGMADVSDTWQRRELDPFKKLIEKGEVDALMTAHIVNAKRDPSRKPATLSKKIIAGLLREQIGYDGVVISDDMQMHAISKHYGFEEAIVLSINAGVDMVMFANNIELSDRVSPQQIHNLIKMNVIEGKIPLQRIEDSYRRIKNLKKDRL